MGVKHDLILATHIQIFECLRETFYRYALECLEPTRTEKKMNKKKSPTESSDSKMDPFEGPCLAGTRFHRQRQPSDLN